MNRERLKQQLIFHEGMVLKPYRDTKGIWTIGVGRNMEANPVEDELGRQVDSNGISEGEAIFLLNNDITTVEKQVKNNIPAYFQISEPRKHVLLDMAFNLGISGLLRFQNMLRALNRSDYNRTAEEMLNSLWAQQVGKRAQTLATMMRFSMPFDQAVNQTGGQAFQPTRTNSGSNQGSNDRDSGQSDRDSFDEERFRDRDER